MPLDEHVRYAETAQEQGEGQAHQGAAHDEDGHPVIGFLLHQGSRGEGSGCGAHRCLCALWDGFRVLNHPRGSRESRDPAQAAQDQEALTSRHSAAGVPLPP
ncbi:hypothetical protein GCM10010236_20550 [Streptomyces eurythermus]|nr:hypothetical protein GCM10010236_20550 [Streptomyces eurythermus]